MDFLFEIGLEEVPARMIAGAEAELRKRVVGLLGRERLITGDDYGTISHSTPRRLAVRVWGVKARQEDVAEEVMGPAVKIAFPKGREAGAGQAGEAFAKKAGVGVDALKVVTTAKGEYVAATVVKAGRAAAEVIAAELPKELAGIYWAKSMYWLSPTGQNTSGVDPVRAGKPERFVRPVRWMVALLGDAVVPVWFGGYEAGRTTFGHRVLYGGAGIELRDAGEYVEALRGASVIVDVEARRHVIRKALDRVCRTIRGETGPGARWREDHALVDKMTHMTEWPSVIAGGFEPEYLALPEEVLVTVMRDHQNYFAVEAGDGRLAPHFLAVLNTVADEKGEAVIRHGNERVLRARFNDARFFWEFDQRVTLEERVGLLPRVVFQKELGSYATKTDRFETLARWLGQLVMEQGMQVDQKSLDMACSLAKTDLTTELVKEFTELQGIVGGLYARAQDLHKAIADSIYDQYKPMSMTDTIPRTVEGQLLAVADKADTIAGMFSLGLEPTGSKDPFALRRAGNGIVRILAEGSLPLRLGQISDRAVRAFAKSVQDESRLERIIAKVEVFLAERLEFYLREAKGQAYDVVKAVLAVGADDVRDAVARAEAVTAVRGGEDFRAVSAAFKRMKNILAQAGFEWATPGWPEGLVDGMTAQGALLGKAIDVSLRVRDLRLLHSYREALEEMASLRPEVDAFFEQVMVMDPDAKIREDRLRMLAMIVRSFSNIADFSEIVVAG